MRFWCTHNKNFKNLNEFVFISGYSLSLLLPRKHPPMLCHSMASRVLAAWCPWTGAPMCTQCPLGSAFPLEALELVRESSSSRCDVEFAHRKCPRDRFVLLTDRRRWRWRWRWKYKQGRKEVVVVAGVEGRCSGKLS